MLAGNGLKYSGNLFDNAIAHLQVHFTRGSEDFEVHTLAVSKLRERIHIGFDEWAAESCAGLEASRGNTLVETERKRKVRRICIDVLAEAGEFIDEADLCSNECS